MKTWILAGLAGFLGTFVSGTLLALAILQPFVSKSFGPHVRTAAQGLNYPSLIGGYLVVSFIMAALYPKLTLGLPWPAAGAGFGLLMGSAVFFGGHLIVAGWSTMPFQPMLLSGLVDALCGLAGGVAIAFVYK